MTKADLVHELAVATNCSKREAFDLVEDFFALLKETIEAGEDLKISGFGMFEVRNKKARRGRNPKTGEGLTITPRRVLTFRPSAVLRKRLNRSGDAGLPE